MRTLPQPSRRRPSPQLSSVWSTSDPPLASGHSDATARPRGCSAAEQRDELAALHHSITSSARTINVIGTWSPIALAALRLRISSNFVGCSIGRLEGLAPAKNFVDVDGSATIKVGVVRSIRDQPSGIDVLLRDVDCGQPMTRRQLRDEASIFLRESVDADNEHVYML